MDVETILQGLTFLVPIKQALINLAPVRFGGLGLSEDFEFRVRRGGSVVEVHVQRILPHTHALNTLSRWWGRVIEAIESIEQVSKDGGTE
jgi:hypothetical protein